MYPFKGIETSGFSFTPMKFIIAKKIEMSQKFKDNGIVVPVTLLQAGPCFVTQLKTKENDGYDAIQLGFVEDKKPSKPEQGKMKITGKAFKIHREFPMVDSEKKVGDVVDVSQFVPGEFVAVTGISKGKGFQGVVKRHHFRGGPASHGHKDNLRMPGSIGSGGMQRVFKALRMGGDQVTVKNLEVVEVDAVSGVIAVKGAVPGAFGSILMLSGGHTEKQSWK